MSTQPPADTPEPEQRVVPTDTMVPAPRRRRVRRRAPEWRTWAAVVVVAALFGLFGWYELQAHPFGGPGKSVLVEVTTGESYSAAAAAFSKAGVIGDTTAFRLYSMFHGRPTLQPGYYTVPKNSTFGALHQLLAQGPNTSALEVPPGFTMAEIAARLEHVVSPKVQADFTDLLTSGKVRSPYEPPGSNSLEGLVAPGTYLLPPDLTATGLLTKMISRFTVMATSVGLTPTTSFNGPNAYQLVTISSVVEKEGYYVKNMPQVARVIFNRLANAMPLQMDSTVLYSLGQDGGKVTADTLKIDTPYNTYLHAGLPPTPICVVSLAALKATMDPPAGSWLFFTLVSKDGTMAFADTYQQQLANQRLAASRGL